MRDVPAYERFRRLISRLTATEEFDKLCFDFGIELDEDVSFARVTGIELIGLNNILDY